jgi:hypothetical protein
MVLSDVSAKNCFGSAARDLGHKRLPVPPASMIGVIAFLKCIMLLLLSYQHGKQRLMGNQSMIASRSKKLEK